MEMKQATMLKVCVMVASLGLFAAAATAAAAADQEEMLIELPGGGYQSEQYQYYNNRPVLKGNKLVLIPSPKDKAPLNASLKCSKFGEPCGGSTGMSCCSDLQARCSAPFSFDPQYKCEWCPSLGGSCGLRDPCCPPLECTGWAAPVTGTCTNP